MAFELDRSLQLLIALIGVLKAGGAYLPLDPNYPRERLNFMLKDSGAKVLITSRNLENRLDTGECQLLFVEEGSWDLSLNVSRESPPKSETSPDDLAYVIYTSGSTGIPKGVQVSRRSLLNHNFATAAAYKLQPNDQVLQFSPISFDISVEEIFPTLLSGATFGLPSG